MLALARRRTTTGHETREEHQPKPSCLLDFSSRVTTALLLLFLACTNELHCAKKKRKVSRVRAYVRLIAVAVCLEKKRNVTSAFPRWNGSLYVL